MRSALAALAFSLLTAPAAQADGNMCGPEPGPVLVVVVESKARVPGAAAGLSPAPRLVDTADTVIYADGRAVTSDLAAVSSHLNELGWAERPIEIAGAGTSRRPSPAPPGGSSSRRRRG